jgi:hypothetical protein
MPGSGGDQPRLCHSAVIGNDCPRFATQQMSLGEVNCTETAWQRCWRVRSSTSRLSATSTAEPTREVHEGNVAVAGRLWHGIGTLFP